MFFRLQFSIPNNARSWPATLPASPGSSWWGRSRGRAATWADHNTRLVELLACWTTSNRWRNGLNRLCCRSFGSHECVGGGCQLPQTAPAWSPAHAADGISHSEERPPEKKKKKLRRGRRDPVCFGPVMTFKTDVVGTDDEIFVLLFCDTYLITDIMFATGIQQD